jgi:hypothetical protein
MRNGQRKFTNGSRRKQKSLIPQLHIKITSVHLLPSRYNQDRHLRYWIKVTEKNTTTVIMHLQNQRIRLPEPAMKELCNVRTHQETDSILVRIVVKYTYQTDNAR